MENEFLLGPRRTNGGDGDAGAPPRRPSRPGAIIVVLGVALAFGRPTSVSAAEFLLRIGDLQVPAGTVVHGAAIAVGGTAYVDGTVEGDAIAIMRAALPGVRTTSHSRFGTATATIGGLRIDIATARREAYSRPGALPGKLNLVFAASGRPQPARYAVHPRRAGGAAKLFRDLDRGR